MRSGGHRSLRGIAVQAAVIAAAALLLWFAAANAAGNLGRLGINVGFGFLNRPAGFAISQHLIPYGESSTYLRALAVATLNTLVLAVVAILMATPVGFMVGIGRRSANGLVAAISGAYVDLLRNVPLLLQLFFWYFAMLRPLPPPASSYSLFGIVFLNARGLFLPAPVWTPGAGFPLGWEVPHLAGFNFSGGFAVQPEFLAMALALSLYSAAYIAEIVRAGLDAVPRGQIEAARALGLKQGRINAEILVPQALRLILPPLGNEYLRLVRNTTLAAAIAYPDLMQIFGGTVLNQTAQALEAMAIVFAIFLVINAGFAALINAYNRRIARGYR